MVVHNYNPSTQEAKTRRIMSSRPAMSSRGLGETLSFLDWGGLMGIAFV
jgi:hypothetical protein